MIRPNRPRTVAVAAVAALAWTVAGSGSASGAEIAEIGWWSRNPLSSAPEGGFAVGAAPDGPTAVAALRVDLGGGVETLVLEVAPTTDATALASLEVCTAGDGWAAAAPGALDDAPATACEGEAVPFGAAGERWRADVSSLVQAASGPVTLAVVPVAGSGTVPFEVAFEAPAVVATGETAEAPSGDGSGSLGSSPPVTTASPRPAPPPRASAAPAPAPIRIGGAATGGAPSVAAPTTTAAPAADAAAEAPAEDDGAGSTMELATSGLLDGAASDPRWGEAVVLVLIGLAVGAGTWGTSRFAARRA